MLTSLKGEERGVGGDDRLGDGLDERLLLSFGGAVAALLAGARSTRALGALCWRAFCGKSGRSARTTSSAKIFIAHLQSKRLVARLRLLASDKWRRGLFKSNVSRIGR